MALTDYIEIPKDFADSFKGKGGVVYTNSGKYYTPAISKTSFPNELLLQNAPVARLSSGSMIPYP